MREAHELRTEVMSSLEYAAQIRVVSTEEKADTAIHRCEELGGPVLMGLHLQLLAFLLPRVHGAFQPASTGDSFKQT